MTKLKTLAVAGMTMGLALGAQAETVSGIKYIDENGVEQTSGECTVATVVDSRWEDGWYVVNSTLSLSHSIEVSGDVKLILMDGCSLTVKGAENNAAIKVSGDGNSLAIYGQTAGTGELNATGGSSSAGIGGNYGLDSGIGSNITINGGTIKAAGSGGYHSAGAGIGGSHYSTGSNITINGGKVIAMGGKDTSGSNVADGIGNGMNAENASTNIKVNPLMTLKADENDPPTTVIPNTGTDLANALKGKRYVTVSIDYSLILKDGEAYRDSVEDANKITSLIASAGLTCADNIWTMSNFVFKTSASPAFRVQSDTTIVLVGTNSVVAGVDQGGSTGLMLESAVTIMGDGVLNAEAVNAERESALSVDNKSFTISGEACIFAKSAGEGSSNKVAVDARSGELSATVTDATTGEKLTYDKPGQYYKDAQGNVATYVKLTEKPPIPPVTVAVPEVAGATAQLYAFNANGGWASVATNEVPSNATVRVVWTVTEDGKALSGEGATGVYVWQTEFGPVIGGEVAPAPTVGEVNETEVTIGLDTRAKKSYFETEGILPIWYAQDAEVKVDDKTLVKNAVDTNTVSWVPAEQGTYNFSQNGFNDAQIIYITPVNLTTNGLEVAETKVEVTADGAMIPEDGRIASNSTVMVTWTATTAGKYFMDGTTSYTASFTATGAESFDAASVLKAEGLIPEEPQAPSVKIGVVGQRYPWNGVLSVQYWAKNTPNTGYQITITVTLPDGTAKSETYDCKNGKNTVAFNAREKFGEVKFSKGVKVRATLIP